MSRTVFISNSTSQTRGEELANSLTHGLGTALSIAGLVLMVVFAAKAEHDTARKVVGATIFGASLILLYLMSTLYHAFRSPRVKLVFKVFDHSAIFMLIAGTYTPFCLSVLRGAMGWTLFGLVWGLAVLGIVFKAVFYSRLAGQLLRPPAVDHLHSLPGRPDLNPVFVKRMGWISTCIYLAMGWLIAIPILAGAVSGVSITKFLSLHGFYWLFGGGLFYSLGAGVYSLEKLRFHHALWHLFVVGGSACHVFAVLFHVIQGK